MSDNRDHRFPAPAPDDQQERLAAEALADAARADEPSEPIWAPVFEPALAPKRPAKK